MKVDQIYIKHLYILKVMLVLIGLSLIALCVMISTNSKADNNIYNNTSLEFQERVHKNHSKYSKQDTCILVNNDSIKNNN